MSTSIRNLFLVFFCTLHSLYPSNAACRNQSIAEHLIDVLNLGSEEMRNMELEIRLTNGTFGEESGKWLLDFSNHVLQLQLPVPFTIFTNPSQRQREYLSKNKTELLILILPANSVEFYSAIKQAVEEDPDNALEPSPENPHDYHRHWQPKYFFLYPERLQEGASMQKLLNETDSLIKNISVNEDIYIITLPPEQNGNTSLWELYSIAGVKFFQQVQQSCDCGCQIVWKHLNNKFCRRKNFRNATIKAIAPANYMLEAEVLFGETPNGDAIFLNGTSVSMLRFLAEGLNFTEHAMKGQRTFAPDGNEGALGGDAAEIRNGKADLSIEQTTITPRRRKEVRFLHSTYFDGVDAFFVQPPVSTARNLYIAPFNLDLWLAMFGSWLLLIVGMKACAWIKGLRAEVEDEDKEVLKDVFLWAVGAICQQGWHIQPVSMSLRIIFVVGYLCGLLCFVAFSAAIVSLLSVKIVPVKTMEDLSGNSFHMFANPNSTPLEGLEHLINEQPGYPLGTIVSEEVAIRQLTKSKSAILTYPDVFFTAILNETTLGAQIREKDYCETYYSVPVSKTPLRSGMMVNLKSPFVDFFNCQILLMRERGLNFRYVYEYSQKTEVKCLVDTSGFTQALGILDVLTAFYILGGGHVLSFAILWIEITLRKSTTSTVTMHSNRDGI